jgi:hypothetical protein
VFQDFSIRLLLIIAEQALDFRMKSFSFPLTHIVRRGANAIS